MKNFILILALAFLFISPGFSQPVDLNQPPEGTITISGGGQNGLAGMVVKTIADFNGDGNTPDLAIGAPGEDTVYIIWARAGSRRYPLRIDLDNLLFQGISISGKSGSKFGSSIAPIGDLNRDGRTEIAVGAPSATTGGTVYIVKGAANTIYGGSQDPNPFLLTINGQPGESIGQYLPDGAEFNDDTYADIAIPTSSLSYKDTAYLVYGNIVESTSEISTRSLPPSESAVFEGLNNKALPFISRIKNISFIGDYNHDGFTDLAVFSGISADNTETIVHIIPGGTKPVGRFTDASMPEGTITVHINAFSDIISNVVEFMSGKDFNNDGLLDLVFGFPNASLNPGYENPGILAIIPGQKELTNQVTIKSATDGNLILIPHSMVSTNPGSTISITGTKMAIGEPLAVTPYVTDATAGAAYIIDIAKLLPSSTPYDLNKKAGSMIFGRKSGDQLGISLTFLPDYNLDGIEEFFVGNIDTSNTPIPAFILTPRDKGTPVLDWNRFNN